MIVKECDPCLWDDKFTKAGAKAESQLAFYLKRKFAAAPDVLIFNGLRLVDSTGDAAQIDHLIVHRHGFVIIESKSVISKVRINDRGEWSRYFNGYWNGMPSPILQGQRQVDFLKAVLNANKEAIRDKVFLLNKVAHFNVAPFEILVAISDSGIVEGRAEGVYKADQIPDEVERIIKRHKKAAGLLNLSLSLKDGMDKFSDGELERLREFLLAVHVPAVKTKAPKAEVKQVNPEQPAQGTLCKHCGGVGLQVLYGKYGYYFKCLSCDKNTPIDFTCPQCSEKVRIRKEGKMFYRECKACSSSDLFYENRIA